MSDSECFVTFNVLILSAFDSTNYVYSNLYRELLRRNCKCYVVFSDPENFTNNKMLNSNNVKLYSIKEITDDILKSIDFVILPPGKSLGFGRLMKKIENLKIFTLSFFHLNMAMSVKHYVDAVLCMGEYNATYSKKIGFNGHYIYVGNPQYDDLIVNRKSNIDKSNIKRVLFIEQGAYPYGDEGKNQIADTFISIAQNNPNMEFIVKPRYLYDECESRNQLHHMGRHFYDYLKERDIPSNVTLMNDFCCLEDLLDDFDAAITTCSTAYISVLLKNMPIIFLTGFSTIDSYSIPKHNFDAIYNKLKNYGTVFNFHDISSKKLVFKPCTTDLLEREVYDFMNPASGRIVDLLEFFKLNMVNKNIRFNEFFSYGCDEFYEHYSDIKKIDLRSEQYTLSNKYFTEVNSLYNNVCFKNLNLCWSINTDDIKNYWNKIVDENTNDNDINTWLNEFRKIINDTFYAWFNSNHKTIHSNSIMEYYYYEFLYNQKEYDKLLLITSSNLCPEGLYYYRYLSNMKTANYEKAAQDYIKFKNYTEAKKFDTVFSDTEHFIVNNFCPEFVASYRNKLKFIRYFYVHKEYKKILELEYKRKYDDEVLNYYKMLAAVAIRAEREVKEEIFKNYKKSTKFIRGAL